VRSRRGGDQLLAVILALCVMGIGYILATGWRAFEIALDTEPPSIDREATTHGWLASRTVTIRLVVHENMELDLERVRVWYSLPYAGPAYQHVDVSMHLEEHSGDTWILESDQAVEFQGPATPTIYYEVYDKAGNRDYWQTTIYFTSPEERITAKVYLNGKEVSNRSERVYVNDPTVELAVDIVSGEQYVEGAYFKIGYKKDSRPTTSRINLVERAQYASLASPYTGGGGSSGELNAETSSGSSGGYDYMIDYELPYPDENDIYTVNVYLEVVDSDSDLLIASFTLDLTDTELNKEALIMVAALVGVAMAGYVFSRRR